MLRVPCWLLLLVYYEFGHHGVHFWVLFARRRRLLPRMSERFLLPSSNDFTPILRPRDVQHDRSDGVHAVRARLQLLESGDKSRFMRSRNLQFWRRDRMQRMHPRLFVRLGVDIGYSDTVPAGRMV